MTRGLRPEVMAFAHAMEAALQINDPRKGTSWKGMGEHKLLKLATDSIADLHGELQRAPVGRIPAEILKHAADAANYLMMVADVCGTLATPGYPCWLCAVADGRPMETITTERDTPHGPKCAIKRVLVHPGCYLDMQP